MCNVTTGSNEKFSRKNFWRSESSTFCLSHPHWGHAGTLLVYIMLINRPETEFNAGNGAIKWQPRRAHSLASILDFTANNIIGGLPAAEQAQCTCIIPTVYTAVLSYARGILLLSTVTGSSHFVVHASRTLRGPSDFLQHI